MNKKLIGLMCVLMLVMFASHVFAAGNWRKGKRTYRSVCISCHKSRSDAGRLALDSKTRKQWTEFFTADPSEIHEKAWDKLDKDDIGNLEMYFRKYAKDVNNLLGCG